MELMPATLKATAPGAGAVDSKGYAVFGTPGPSQYDCVSQFDDGGKRIYHKAGGPFSIQGRWKSENVAFTSPGPQAHNPKLEAVNPDPNHAVFGHSTRATESKRFTAACLISAPHEPRVGPGAYRYKCGKGHAKTFGDGPCAAIGEAPRMPDYKSSTTDSPGAKYDLPSSLRSGPALLGPRENAFGKRRERQEEAIKARRQYNGPGVPASPTETPAPGHYCAENSALAALQKAPRAVFDKAPLSNAPKLATGGLAFEEGLKGTESAAKFYDVPSSLERRGGAAAYSKRFPDATKGLGGTGPCISKQHITHVLGVESPGPKYDVDKGHSATKNTSPAYTMASSRQQPPDFSATPGAAAYLLKKDSAACRQPNAAAFSMASGRAFQVPVGISEGPGPGAHECQRGIAHPDIRKARAPATSMGKAEEKYGRVSAMMSREDVPGPGAYIVGVQTKVVGPKFTMNGRDGGAKDGRLPRSQSEGAPASRQHEIRRFYSRMQAAADLGHETITTTLPNLQGQSNTGKEIGVVKKYVGKMARSGREDDAKLMVSRFHAKWCVGKHSPGPAQYSPERALSSEAQSCYRHQGGFSFGKGERPLAKQGLAKVTF